MLFRLPKLGAREDEVLKMIRDLWNSLHANLGIQSRRWGGLLARNLRARAIQGSNSIEGFVVSDEDALAAVDGDAPEDADEEAWLAVKGYRTAMNYVLRLASATDFTYEVNLIRSLHFMMTEHATRSNPGTWRPGPIFVKNATGETVYEGPKRELVPALMDEFCAGLSAQDQAAPTRMLRAAMAHLNLVMVHPFSDGNGRMSRCIQTLVLARGGVLDPTFCSIEEYLGRNTTAYYASLAEVGAGSWHPERSALPWIRFCLSAHYIQAETARRRLEFTAQVGEHVETLLQKMGLPDRAAISLTNAVLGFRVRNESYRREADVSQALASRDLKVLSDAGLLDPFGVKRGRFYRVGAELRDLAKLKSKAPRVRDPFEILAA